MRVLLGEGRGAPALASAIFLIGLGGLALTVFSGLPLLGIAVATIAATVFAISHRWLLRWQTLLGTLILVILFIPIRRYVLPGALPFQLEPYRILVAVFVAFWLTSLLIDRRVHLRRSGLEGPVFLIVFSALVSDVLNSSRISSQFLGSYVVKSLTFFLAFILVFYLVVSVARSFDQVARLVKILVGGGSVVGVLAIIESRTQYNVFDHLHSVFPILQSNFDTGDLTRNGRFRAVGSAQHPIALSAALALLVPLAVWLACSTKRRRWWLAAAALVMGGLATHSRTGFVMLLVELLIFSFLWPAQLKRFWPLLLPAALVLHIALPGTIGSLRASFFPKGGLVQEQRGYKDQGRVGDIAPTFHEISSEPLFGQGFGTRIINKRLVNGVFTEPNARILDDQWLATLLETGVVGAFAWLWLFVRSIRRLLRAAKAEDGPHAWLMAALLASITAYAVGMLTYDAFSFIQVTFFLFILLGFACALLAPVARRAEAVVLSPASAQ
jgi:O-antigen ligase/polysaccharide polymerase Wzy-like membrane protein